MLGWAAAMTPVRQLIAAGADVNATNREGNSALILAAEGGRADVVEALLAGGADVGMMNKRRERAITVAEASGHDEVVDMLSARQAPKRRLFGLF